MAGKMKELKPYIKKQETRVRKLHTSTDTIINLRKVTGPELTW
jgi:hypothetical protein